MKNKMSLSRQHLYQYEDLKHSIVNEEKAAIYCYLPNVASTNFQQVFLGLQSDIPKFKVLQVGSYLEYFTHSKRFTVKDFNQFKPEIQSRLLRIYKNILVVRDPLEPLLLAYADRFLHANGLRKEEYHDKVANFYEQRPDLRVKNDMCIEFGSEEISFKEFLIYFCDVYEAKEYVDEHFAASYQLCNPCSIQYDYICKYETLNTDASYIFNQLNIAINSQKKTFSSDSKVILAENLYKVIPARLLRKTWNVIQLDYHMFGYKLPVWYKEKMREK